MRKKVLVVTHDAGGSEIIAAYVKANRARYDFRIYTAGPGARIFRRLRIPFRPIADDRTAIRTIMERHADAQRALLALPGWMTGIERIALQEAKRAGIKTAVYLEDWRAYRERLGYPQSGWKTHLPDEVWAGDDASLALAQRQFARTSSRVRYVRNEFFGGIVKRFRAARTRKARSILFLSSAWGGERVLKDLLRQLSGNAVRATLRIRLHPAEDRSRFDALIRQYRSRVRVERSDEQDLAKDLARAAAVIGSQTVALPIAALCGVPAFDIKAARRSPRATSQRWTARLTPPPPFPGVVRAASIRAAMPRILRALAA